MQDFEDSFWKDVLGTYKEFTETSSIVSIEISVVRNAIFDNILGLFVQTDFCNLYLVVCTVPGSIHFNKMTESRIMHYIVIE